MPGTLLLRSLPKILLYQAHIRKVARGNGSGHTVLAAWGSFLRAAPSTLRKRRGVMRRRVITARELNAVLISEYPVPTGLTPRELREWFRHRIGGPLLRLGGDLLEHVPARIRPRIRGRDRR
jgi:hypothetical protein